MKGYILLAALVLASPCWAFRTNIQALREALMEAVRGMEVPASWDTVRLKPEEDDERNWFVEATLEEFLTEMGHKVTSDTSFLGPTLSFRILKLGLSCKEGGLLGRYVKRWADAELTFRWTEGGRVLKVENLKGGYFDRFPSSLLPELAHSQDPPFKAEVEGRDWGKVVEPLVVSVVVGGLLYLFYSVR
ncbi:MAG TPA: hypothetical protein EYP61_08110 [Candidatus Latescibacteria bacterium]|nr:hypothetical protein [Candidatus Latescibacterota bacterium]